MEYDVAFSRITITVPRDVLRQADARARDLDRSRSWVVAQALRAFLRTPPSAPELPAYLPGLGESRLAQLEADLAETPEARVRAADETLRVSVLVRERVPRETRLAEVCSLLNEQGAKYVLVGACALQLWGHGRATKDIDILIEKTVENGGHVLAALGEVGYGLAKEWLAEEIVKRPFTIIGDDPRVDVLTVAWSVHYPEAARDAKVFTVEGVPIPTASIDHLIASKRTGRLQDAADIEVLQEIRRRQRL